MSLEVLACERAIAQVDEVGVTQLKIFFDALERSAWYVVRVNLRDCEAQELDAPVLYPGRALPAATEAIRDLRLHGMGEFLVGDRVHAGWATRARNAFHRCGRGPKRTSGVEARSSASDASSPFSSSRASPRLAPSAHRSSSGACARNAPSSSTT